MKAFIKEGILCIQTENSTEDYALNQWLIATTIKNTPVEKNKKYHYLKTNEIAFLESNYKNIFTEKS